MPSAAATAVGSRARLLARPERSTVRAAAGAASNLLSLARGDPDQATPAHVIEAAKRALDGGYTHYTPWLGIPELRRAIAKKLARDNGVAADSETEILITTGAQEAVFCAMQMLLEPGDEVLMPDPHFTAYDSGILLAGAKIVHVPTYAKDGWAVRVEELERLITPRTRAIVLVTPNNPPGNVLSRERLLEIAELAKQRDLTVISDEVYEHFVYGERQHVSMASLPAMRDRTISIWSFSKSYAMTGWRLGYLVAPADAIAAIAELKYDITICAPAVTQMAGLAALEGPQDETAQRRALYERRARHFERGLNDLGLTCPPLEGGICVFPEVKSTGMSSTDFCLHMIREAKLHVLPGVQYGPYGEGYVRMSILADFPVIDDALTRLRAALPRP